MKMQRLYRVSLVENTFKKIAFIVPNQRWNYFAKAIFYDKHGFGVGISVWSTYMLDGQAEYI